MSFLASSWEGGRQTDKYAIKDPAASGGSARHRTACIVSTDIEFALFSGHDNVTALLRHLPMRADERNVPCPYDGHTTPANWRGNWRGQQSATDVSSQPCHVANTGMLQNVLCSRTCMLGPQVLSLT